MLAGAGVAAGALAFALAMWAPSFRSTSLTIAGAGPPGAVAAVCLAAVRRRGLGLPIGASVVCLQAVIVAVYSGPGTTSKNAAAVASPTMIESQEESPTAPAITFGESLAKSQHAAVVDKESRAAAALEAWRLRVANREPMPTQTMPIWKAQEQATSLDGKCLVFDHVWLDGVLAKRGDLFEVAVTGDRGERYTGFGGEMLFVMTQALADVWRDGRDANSRFKVKIICELGTRKEFSEDLHFTDELPRGDRPWPRFTKSRHTTSTATSSKNPRRPGERTSPTKMFYRVGNTKYRLARSNRRRRRHRWPRVEGIAPRAAYHVD